MYDPEFMNLQWCHVCTKLYKTDVRTTRKWYTSIEDWYRRDSTNKTPVCKRTYRELEKTLLRKFKKKKEKIKAILNISKIEKTQKQKRVKKS